ncbi:transposase [Methylobacterium aquaticum]|uniref:transposase n=1 Tax=Methylobacterium aquaticum TaxID=270351 RepID=UPI00065383C3|nr:transposase [Methylobacterium aquaticum]
MCGSGGAWRALPESVVPWRTVYGWLRHWIEKRLFEILMRALARRQRRRHAAGAGCRQEAVAEPAPGAPGWGLHGQRCQEWCHWHGMGHRVVETQPDQKGFVALERRWLAERTLGWLSH